MLLKTCLFLLGTFLSRMIVICIQAYVHMQTAPSQNLSELVMSLFSTRDYRRSSYLSWGNGINTRHSHESLFRALLNLHNSLTLHLPARYNRTPLGHKGAICNDPRIYCHHVRHLLVRAECTWIQAQSHVAWHLLGAYYPTDPCEFTYGLRYQFYAHICMLKATTNNTPTFIVIFLPSEVESMKVQCNNTNHSA